MCRLVNRDGAVDSGHSIEPTAQAVQLSPQSRQNRSTAGLVGFFTLSQVFDGAIDKPAPFA